MVSVSSTGISTHVEAASTGFCKGIRIDRGALAGDLDSRFSSFLRAVARLANMPRCLRAHEVRHTPRDCGRSMTEVVGFIVGPAIFREME